MPTRQFDGTDDVLVLDEGTLDTVLSGAVTVAVLFNRNDDTLDGTQFLVSLNSGVNSGQRGAVSISPTNVMQFTIGGITRTFGFTISDDTWYLFVVKKADGDSQTPRANLYNYTAASWAGWADGNDTLDDDGTTLVEVRIGNGPGGFPFNGLFGGAVIYSTALSDGNAETLETSAQNWFDLTPTAMWRLNQASTATPVTDDTGNGADETSLTGTTVSSDVPTGFDFSLGATTISPTGIASAEAFGTAVITTGPVTVSPTGIASAEAFGTAVITTGPVTVSPTGIASAEAFGTAVVTVGEVTISPTGIASAEAFGTATITTGPVTISPTGIASAEAFGTAVVTVQGAETIFPAGIASAEAFGNATITVGGVTISPVGIASAEAFGTPIVFDPSAGQIIQPVGIPSQERFGRPVVFHRVVRDCDCSLLVDA